MCCFRHSLKKDYFGSLVRCKTYIFWGFDFTLKCKVFRALQVEWFLKSVLFWHSFEGFKIVFSSANR